MAKSLRLEEENGDLEKRLQTTESQMATLIVENKGYAEDIANLQKNFDMILAPAIYQVL